MQMHHDSNWHVTHSAPANPKLTSQQLHLDSSTSSSHFMSDMCMNRERKERKNAHAGEKPDATSSTRERAGCAELKTCVDGPNSCMRRDSHAHRSNTRMLRVRLIRHSPTSYSGRRNTTDPLQRACGLATMPSLNAQPSEWKRTHTSGRRQ